MTKTMAMEKMLNKADLAAWMGKLETHQLFAPKLEDEGVWNYAPVVKVADVSLDQPNTVRPPKDFVFPQRETLYRFEQVRGEAPVLTETLPDPTPSVVFGVRPCDSRGLVRQDIVFTKEFDDPYFQGRRAKTIFVGQACKAPPSPNCFCNSVGGSPSSEDGLDLLMTELDGKYHVKAVTQRGADLLAKGGALFKEASASDKAAVAKANESAKAHPQRPIKELGKVAGALKKNFDSKAWDEMAKACIGCGICTFLCPTCHCFDINDEVTCSSPCKGERVRTWDTCQFPDFTMHTSGHNPRETLGSRLRQRVCHKFQYFTENHDMPQCTGCGRCISLCPVGIDIVSVVERLGQP
ncbi:MAG: 4Fe-4S dicluster domain-containing protein [Rhodospirillales bacterium]|nr:4Fe-4S dicluster domain-containing protein [Rhodospirillales bacterium]